MSRFLPPAWFLSAGVVALLVAGFGYADKTRLHWYAAATVVTADPDRVVGVIRRCDLTDGKGAKVGDSGDACAMWKTRPGVVLVDDRLEITVRTSQGTTYLVTMPVASAVTVGMAWPP